MTERLPVHRILDPFQRFTREQASGGAVLLFCAVAALVWANSPWSDSYASLWETHLRIGIGRFVLDEPLHFWINDTLMAIFFFVVGLEIKREIITGDLSSRRQAALPIIAALGGMVVPALIFTAFNAGGEGSRGWGIPMATDIAFSLGVLALLGTRAPLPLKLFLTGVAIADDIGAVVVIALFYTGDIAWMNVAIGGALLGVLAFANRIGIVYTLFFAIVGAAVWLSFVQSGIHSTVAGVLIAATIPMRVQIDSRGFLDKSRRLLDDFEGSGVSAAMVQTTDRQTAAVHELELACQDVESPLDRIEHEMHRWVAFGVMPLFALANAGVSLGGGTGESVSGVVSLGIMAGLIVGKPVGIVLFAWLAIRSGAATMPLGVTWQQIMGAACLCGIGFTMSLFITGLAFDDESLTSQAKIGILVSSAVAGVAGWAILRRASPAKADTSAPEVQE